MEIKQNLCKFIWKLFSFLIIFSLVDIMLGTIVRYFYFSQPNKYVFGIRDTKADIIVVGSSRAENHYVPEVFKDTLNMTCFNMGSGGQNIYYDYAIVGSILERYSPRIILLDIFDIDYAINDDNNYNTDKLTILLPFYATCNPVREVINLRSKFEKVKLLSQIYPFNSQVSNILYSFVKNNNNPHFINNGFIPLEGTIESRMIKQEQYAFIGIDTLKIKYLRKISSLCKSKNVRLIMITSPWYNKLPKSTQSNKVIQEVATNYGIEYWDYSFSQSFLLNKTLFKDVGHLNYQGARLYSSLIAKRINNSSLTK